MLQMQLLYRVLPSIFPTPGNTAKALLALASAALVTACSHPLEIVGEGDILSGTGNRTCLLEEFQSGQDNCTVNNVVGAYQEIYFAQARPGWTFDRWENYCTDSDSVACGFDYPASVVTKFWGRTVAPLRAVFVSDDNGCDASFGNASLPVAPYGFNNGNPVSADPQKAATAGCVYWVDQQNLDGSASDFTLDTNTDDNNEQFATRDVFLLNTQTGAIARVSDPGAGNVNANNNKEAASPAPSSDGLKIAYVQEATGSSATSGYTYGNVYVRDMATPNVPPVKVNFASDGTSSAAGTPIINDRRTNSLGSRGNSSLPVVDISGDGNLVAFVTNTPLSSEDSNRVSDVYVRDILAQTTTLISVLAGSATGTLDAVKISADGRYVAFASDVDYTEGEFGSGADEVVDLYLMDTSNGNVLLVSSPVGGAISGFDMSADGSRIVFASREPIDSDDTNGLEDVYVADIDLAPFAVLSRQRVSEAEARFPLLGGDSYAPGINPAGDRVSFVSAALDIEPYQASLVEATESFRERLYIADLAAAELFKPAVRAARDGKRSEIAHAALASKTFYYRKVVNAQPGTGRAESDLIARGEVVPAEDAYDLGQVDIPATFVLRGVIDSASDVDIYLIEGLAQTTQWEVLVNSLDCNAGKLADPYVRVLRRTSSGLLVPASNGDNALAIDDNSGSGRGAYTAFTRDSDARYIEVSSADGSTGSYRLHVGAVGSLGLDACLPGSDWAF